ncbi:hypothetical protein [Caulobacter sp. BK020]|nr:hypothetical protein [Caulobacter sp. BK020]TCS18377.1 hypothetical protein EV278_101361 [Caulobacter sp. BK020]
MDPVVLGAPDRARRSGRSSRFSWFMLVVAINLVLWTGVIALIVRAT